MPNFFKFLLTAASTASSIIETKEPSDFLLDINEVREALYLLGDQDIRVIQVLDRVEKNLSMEGDLKLIDSETSDNLRTFISPRLRMQYQQQLDDHCTKIEQLCSKLNIRYNLITTDMPVFDSFYKVIEG